MADSAWSWPRAAAPPAAGPLRSRRGRSLFFRRCRYFRPAGMSVESHGKRRSGVHPLLSSSVCERSQLRRSPTDPLPAASSLSRSLSLPLSLFLSLTHTLVEGERRGEEAMSTAEEEGNGQKGNTPHSSSSAPYTPDPLIATSCASYKSAGRR